MTERAANPTEAKNVQSPAERKRRPFSEPTQKLSAPEIPGFHTHWFLGTPARLARAQEAGYEFVDKSEVQVNNHILGSDPVKDGNTDLGSRVSVVAGGQVVEGGQAARLYLMKIRQEWWEESQQALTAPGSRIDSIRSAMLQGVTGQPENAGHVYVDPKRTKIPEFFKRREERKPSHG